MVGVPGGALVGKGVPAVGALTRLEAWRRNPKILSSPTSADTASIITVADVKLTSPPDPTKDETKKAEVISVGTVTVPEKAEARVIFRLTAAR